MTTNAGLAAQLRSRADAAMSSPKVLPVCSAALAETVSVGAARKVITGVAAYFLPAFIATRRKVPHAGSVVVINVFLGSTI